jgi:beta-catenin-like protein 1
MAKTGTDEIHKAAKTGSIGDVKGKGKATVEDEEDEDTYGVAIPPDDAEYGNEDEEGRFFGGGISEDTADIIDMIEERDKDGTAV